MRAQPHGAVHLDNAQYRSPGAEILEFCPVRPEDHLARPNLSPNFIFKNVTRTWPKPDFLLFQPEWSPIYLQSVLTIVSLKHVSFNTQMPVILDWTI
jgi:hypothetical protein